MSNIITLTRQIIHEQRKFPEATGKFTDLMNDIAYAAKLISYHTNKAGLLDVLGETGKTNIQGEEVMKLDVFANETMINALNHNGHLCVMCSEESEEPIPIPPQYPMGKYAILFDPLDGSSNIDANVSIGTIFSIYKRITPADQPGSIIDLLQPGQKQICAGYVVYGSSTMLVYTTGNGVHGFTLDPSYGEFVLSHPNIKIPEKANMYSVNESNFDYWDEPIKKYIHYVKQTDKRTNRPLNSRYIGSMVSDFHRNLIYGGIYLYPSSSLTPEGKIRLGYEANPLAFIIEEAGGSASNGSMRILDLQPEELHQRTPLFMGPQYDISLLESFIKNKQNE